MNFKSRPEGRLNCRARIGSSAWLRGSSQNSNTKLVQTNQILTIALTTPINTVRFFYLSGYDPSEFNDTPDNTYIFSEAVIFNRNGTTITVILFPTTITSKPVINIYTASSWTGWRYFDGTEVM